MLPMAGSDAYNGPLKTGRLVSHSNRIPLKGDSP